MNLPPAPPAQTAPTPLGTPEAVAAAERAFAARAADGGTRRAFLAFLTEDATVFTPEARNGPAAQRAQPEDGSRLAWEPEQVELAASGDFALSTGPWAWTPAGASQPAAHGHFLSLWVLREGRWRVLLDVGTPHPPQAARPLVARRLGAPADPGAGEALQAAWRDHDAQAAVDPAAAFRTWGAGDLRLYRPGRPLRAGEFLEGGLPGLTWTGQGAQVAGSADLAFRWGLRGSGEARASAVQVWRREAGGWRLAMDVALPLPQGR